MISTLITLLIVCVVAGLIMYILSLFPLPQPWLNLVRIIVLLIVLIWLLAWLVPSVHLLR